MLAFVKAVAEI